jgi:hypothetical protein
MNSVIHIEAQKRRGGWVHAKPPSRQGCMIVANSDAGFQSRYEIFAASCCMISQHESLGGLAAWREPLFLQALS